MNAPVNDPEDTATGGAGPQVYARIAAHVHERSDAWVTLSKDLHARPELAMEETYATERLTGTLAAEGFTVQTGIGGLPTAFRGAHGADAPVIAFLCEYDALPGIGHGCGHNLIATGGLAAATALAAAGPGRGTVACIGTPGEEGAGGKVLMLDAGVFDDVTPR